MSDIEYLLTKFSHLILPLRIYSGNKGCCKCFIHTHRERFTHYHTELFDYTKLHWRFLNAYIDQKLHIISALLKEKF